MDSITYSHLVLDDGKLLPTFERGAPAGPAGFELRKMGGPSMEVHASLPEESFPLFLSRFTRHCCVLERCV